MATQEMADALPRLPDDDLVGRETDHIVVRDGERDLKFRGTLLVSVAPDSTWNGRWRELRVYKTVGGKKVFCEVGRSILDDERDKFKVMIFDPLQPATSGFCDGVSMPSEAPKCQTEAVQVRTEIAALTEFFKFSDLAKKLYAKLGISTEEIIQ